MKNRQNELVSQLSDKELLFHLYLTQIVLLTITIVLGIIMYDDFSFLENLNWQDTKILWVGAGCGIAVVLLDILLMRLLPESLYDDGGLNERIFRNRNVFHTALIAAVVAISEELLFRGVIQTKTGLIIASFIFALIHYRYLFNWFLFVNIVTLSFFIGFIYVWTGNLAVTIVMHFTIDFLLGLQMKFKNYSRNTEQEGLQNE
jgi:membrane protease YdiL (CAAX protease family)